MAATRSARGAADAARDTTGSARVTSSAQSTRSARGTGDAARATGHAAPGTNDSARAATDSAHAGNDSVRGTNDSAGAAAGPDPAASHPDRTAGHPDRTVSHPDRASTYPARARHAQVVHGLGARIVRGGLAPGDAVPTEDELVGQFQVGRSALREGVKVLAGKGLLESRTSAGTRVRPRESWNLLDPDVLRWRFTPSPAADDIQTLANLRVGLEPGAARLAAETATAEQRGMIAVAMARLWATVDDPEAFVEADLDFHRAVFAGANNDLLLYIHDVVSVALSAIRPLHSRSVGHNRDTLPNHERVELAIRRGHHRKAEEAMREIVEVARADALQEA